MKLIDNHIEKLGDDLKLEINNGTKIRICAAIFSMYGFQFLKSELSNIDEFKFIFSDPTFIELTKNDKEQVKNMIIA
jgi:hypothetical protein